MQNQKVSHRSNPLTLLEYLEHVLTSCQTTLTQGRYTWRHDQVLRELADTLEKEHKSKRKGTKAGPTFISFVKEGINPSAGQGNTRTGILDLADD